MPKPGKHTLPQVVQRTPSSTSAKFTLGKSSKHSRSTYQLSTTSSHSSNPHQSGNSKSPPSKKIHTLSNSEDSDDQMHLSEQHPTNQAPLSSFLLTDFDPRFQTPKLLLHQLLKYVPRDSISQLIPTRNGIIIKSSDSNLASTIRNKYSFEIFGKQAKLTPLASKTIRLQPPPHRPPMLSVVIRGVDPQITDTEAETELTAEGHNIAKCLRIKTQQGEPSYMIRVLTTDQATIDDLLTYGAFIYKRRYRVEPSRSSPPIPLRCERCQKYNDHETKHCPNQPVCGYCSDSHPTKACTNHQLPPKCNQCSEPHPTFSYKCKNRPNANPETPAFTVPLRLPEQPSPLPNTSVFPPITIEQLLTFFTLTFQNIYPFGRETILNKVQHAASEIFKVQFQATYSGPYVYFTVSPPPNPE